MKVTFKKFDVTIELKNKGIELDLSDTSGKHIGDLVITKTKLVWCPGKTRRANGKPIEWHEFAKIMDAR